jgi:aspartate/methionine/tyrosine aminotransferase
MFALPGIKFGWAAVTGDEGLVGQAMKSLEFISDTFLPVNEIVQAAAPDVFRLGSSFQRSYVEEVRRRWGVFRELFGSRPSCSFVDPDGGFYLTMRLHDGSEEKIAEALLREAQLLVHPGYFYDLAGNHIVLSFIHDPEIQRVVIPRLIDILENRER